MKFKKVSEISNILNLRSRSQEFFAYCETKNFEWRTWFSVLLHRKIRYPKISERSKGLRTKFSRTLRPKKSKENRDTPLLSIKVFHVPKILKQRGIPYRALLAVYVKKISTEKSDITLLGMKFFESRSFLIYRSVPQRKLSALWAKKFSTESRDIPFSFKIFFVTSHLKLFETLDGSSRSFSVLWDKKNKENRDTREGFRDPTFSETYKWFPGIFRELWDKIFRLKNVISRSQAWKVSIPENFWKVEVVTHEIFQYCEAKKINGESRYTPTEHKSFRCPKNPGSQSGFPANFIGSKRDINSTEKSDITLLGMKFFDSWTFLIYRSVPQRNFSALWDKKFSTECRDIPFFCINFFYTWHLKMSETLDGSSRSFSLLWDKTNRRKTVICKKVSEIPNILNLRSRSQKFFAYCETKNFEWRTWFSVLMHRKTRYPIISGLLKGFRTKFFRTVRSKKWKENRDTPLLSIQVFDVAKILKQTGIPYRDF